jgi:uncharacterized protein (TIGR04255 family)
MSAGTKDSELHFARPPIVEAVIERRFANPISPETLESLRHAFEREYPAVSQMNNVSIAINEPTTQAQVNQTTVGYRLVKLDGAAVILLTSQSISFSRVAPYLGWHDFAQNSTHIFQVARNIMGYSALSRIGVRYINRLDIPAFDKDGVRSPIRPEHYILIYPEYPEIVIPQVHGFTMQCVTALQNVDCQATINVATVVSPVPDHISLVFDIDVGRNNNVPQREDEIANLMEAIRSEKNRIFSSCLTDRMKEYFN